MRKGVQGVKSLAYLTASGNGDVSASGQATITMPEVTIVLCPPVSSVSPTLSHIIKSTEPRPKT